MRFRLIVVLCFVLVLSAGCARTPDRDLLQGTWEPTDGTGPTIHFEDDAVTFRMPAGEIREQGKLPQHIAPEEFKGTFRVGQAREPKELDLIFTEDGRPKKHLAIYKLGGSTLTICFN